MPSLEDTIEFIFKNLNNFTEKRESVIKETRDIITISRKAINLIHAENAEEAEKLINKLKKRVSTLLDKIRNESRLFHSGFVRDSLKEFVEAFLLFLFKKSESKKDFPTPQDLGVTEETYILGLFDFLGELKRVIIENLRAKNYSKAWETLDFAKKILSMLEMAIFADSIIPGYKSKVDGLKRMIVSTEELILKIENEDKLADLINRIDKREKEGYED